MFMFGFFALVGILTLFALGGQLIDGMRARFWTPTPAVVVKSEVRQESSSYVLDLQYLYTFDGKTYTGTRIKPGSGSFSKQSDAKLAYNRYRPDRKLTCYVNPSAPEESYLEKTSPFQILLILIPCVFIGIGVGGIWLMKNANKPRAISQRHKPGSGKLILRIMGGAFMLVGGGLAFGLGVLPWLEARDSETWKEVPCTILTSSISSHRSSGKNSGTTYSLDIQYEYQVDGQTYVGDRYDFSKTSGTKGSRSRAVSQYPEGKQTVCYVNPEDPSAAVLVRESGLSWFLLIPSVFFFVGLLLFANAGKLETGGKSVVPSSAPVSEGSIGGLRGSIGDTSGPVTLSPGASRLGGFIFMSLFALIWNGIVFGVLFFGDVPTGAKVFLSIFGLIGLALLGGAVHQFLSLFNPRPIVQAPSSSVRLGETLEVRFHFEGKTDRIQRLIVTLKAEEVATYRRGTDTRTDRHVFHLVTLLETRDPALMQTGNVTVAIPGDSMHTFNAGNNKIEWKLELHGEIPRWPDVKLDFPITVLPHFVS